MRDEEAYRASDAKTEKRCHIIQNDCPPRNEEFCGGNRGRRYDGLYPMRRRACPYPEYRIDF